VYRLEKRGLGTPEAISEILTLWNLPRSAVEYGGLKDRHAVTSQTITVFQGPNQDITTAAMSLSYLGQASRPFAAHDIVANDFDITLRRLAAGEAESMWQTISQQTFAVPNYFDEQRFGSLGQSGQFVAQPWCHGNYERALYLAIAEANSHDRPDDREQKQILRDNWGDWQTCKDRLDRSHRRSIVTYLVDHPSGFKKAAALIRRDLRSLYVAAFQSKIWNEIISRRMQQLLPPDSLRHVESIAGRWAFPVSDCRELADFKQTRIPLPSGRTSHWDPECARILDQVLAEFDLQRHQLRFSYPRDVFFARGERDAMLSPQRLSAEIANDEVEGTNFRKLTIRFRLRSGQYATMLVKGLQLLSVAT
jgi:tRNA pseudouridine13 synthase